MKNSKYSIGEVITECINNPVVQYICSKQKNMTYTQKDKKEKEFSRALGFCILFKSTEDIEQYMMISEKDEQIKFLKRKIAEVLGFSEDEIESRKEEIIQYAFENFKANGYVFHGANSASIEKKMAYGLDGSGSSAEHKKQLLHIASIYRKYGNDNPLGWGTLDIQYQNNGWFYDGHPKNITYYADSPEWFNQFCG